MKKALILTGVLIITLLAVTGAFARVTPHDVTNNIACADCHDYRPGGVYADSVCTRCHTNQSGGGYSKLSAPGMITHLSQECRDCHEIHWQDQLSTWGPPTWLVEGTITSKTDNGDGTTTFGYSSLTVNNADYTDPATWSAKSDNRSAGNERGLLMLNTLAWNPSAEVISADAGTITVEGTTFQYPLEVNDTFALAYGMFIRSSMWNVAMSRYYNIRMYDSSGIALGFDNSGTGNDTSPSGICQNCHTSTLHWRADGTLADHNSGSNCIECHKHEDGFIASCTACHGDPPTIDAPVQGGLITTDRNNQLNESGSITSGAHQTHFSALGADHAACDRCHKGGMQDAGTGSTGADDLINIGFTLGATDLGGNYDGQSAVASGFYDYVGTGTTTVTTGNSLQCSNVYCHGSTLEPDGGTNTTPVWNDPASGQCGTCHGATIADPPTRGPHVVHAGPSTAEGHDYTCSLCHTDPSSDASLHVNMKSEITFDTSDPKVQSAAYDGTDTVLDPYGNCSNVYCHSNVQTSPPGGALTYQTVNWGDAAIDGCSACHEGPVNHFSTPVTGNTTGSHTKHGASGIFCASCHANDPALDPTGSEGCIICHTVDGPHVTHANYAVDVNFADIYGGNYSGTPAPGDAYGSCSTTYCHSTGQGATASDPNPTYSSPSWGNPASGACGTCHGIAPATGSHAVHINNAGATCEDCHIGAGDGTSYISANHINKSIDVSNGYSMGGAPGNGYGTCSAASCHGGYVTPQWGTTTAPGDQCTICHASPPDTGVHGNHVLTTPTAYGETTVNNLGGEQYDFGCGNCHPTDNALFHQNGTVDLSLDSNDGGPIKSMNNATDQTSGYTQTVGVSVTCNAAYCHSNGYQDNFAYQTTPDWYGGAFAGDKCANCHGNSPNSGGIVGSRSHFTTDAMGTGEIGGHFVGIHYDNIANATGGLATAGSTGTSSHGNAVTSTTINCQTCHNNTVAVSGNDQNTICSGCHDGSTAPLQGNASINASGSTHVNGQPDVMFNATEVLSKAQLRDASIPVQWDRTVSGAGYKGEGAYDESVNRLLTGSQYDGGTKTCAVSCHNDNPVQWGDTGVDCNSCHTGL